jgi:polyisoprenoid-binding protein YceI
LSQVDWTMRYRFILLMGAVSLLTRVDAMESALAIDLLQSRIEIAVKATMDSFVGRLTAYEPTITVAEDGSIAGVRLAFHFKDVVTGKDKRDKAMHSWQHTEEFPDGRFEMTALELTNGAATASGRLTFHGVTRDIRFPVAIVREGQRYSIDGDATIDTREFGLPKIRMMGLLTVDPIVHIRFHLEGVRESPSARQP